MSLDWYPFYTADFRRDTLHLTLAEEGAYRRLIDEYMVSKGPLPDDDRVLARIIGVSFEEWTAVAKSVRTFFHTTNGKLQHKRCEKELHAQAKRVQEKKEHAQKAARAKWKNYYEMRDIVADAERKQSVRTAYAMPNSATIQSKKERGATEKEPAVTSELESTVKARGWAAR